ncbi:hypothetical protein [Marinobacterium litorale]|uniref:hypothetical protein n=1 Tax=Marinobacterium litorale TaxID=404770 RepID=UPI0004163618|nr:hypothetical protein [Marinobacterium litorale]
MSFNNGYFVIGNFHSVQSEPWRNDETKFNHRIILNNPYEDQFGNPQTEVIRVDISQEDLPTLQAQAGRIQGQQVMVPVVCNARKGGSTGAWLSVRMPKGSKLLFPNAQSQERKAS